jgi:hypothetical protein
MDKHEQIEVYATTGDFRAIHMWTSDPLELTDGMKDAVKAQFEDFGIHDDMNAYHLEDGGWFKSNINCGNDEDVRKYITNSSIKPLMFPNPNYTLAYMDPACAIGY